MIAIAHIPKATHGNLSTLPPNPEDYSICGCSAKDCTLYPTGTLSWLLPFELK